MDNSVLGHTEGQFLNTSIADPKNSSTATGQVDIKQNRICTDVYCLFVFLFFNICLWTLSGWSYSEGDHFRLERGWDMYGNFCGAGVVDNRKYTFFPEPLKSIDLSICLEGCPGIMAEESICMYDEKELLLEDEGCFNAYPTKPFFNSYCLPADRQQRVKVLKWLYSSDQVMTRVVGDLARAWDIPAIAGLIAGAVSVLYLLTFRFRPLRYPIYIISLPVLLFLLAAICFLVYEESWRVDGKLCDGIMNVTMEECIEGDTANGYRDLCWVLIAISAVIVTVMVCLIPAAKKGVDVIQTAARVRANSPLIWLCPAIGLILIVAFYAYFVTLIVYQVSCGDYEDKEVPILPQGEVRTWTFNTAERVLVFFSVGMILWWLSFIAHFVEFVTAALATKWVFYENDPVLPHFRATLYESFRFHTGSILLASVIIPAGRFFRNIFLGLKSFLSLIHLQSASKFCLCLYEYWFQYMTSSCIAFQTILGTSLMDSARKAHHLLARQSRLGPQTALNQGDRLIWLTQLVVILIGPDFVAYWIQHKALTFRDVSTREITSVVAMAIYGLFLTWALSQLYGCIIRGLLYGYTLANLIREDIKQPLDGSSKCEQPVLGMPTEGGVFTNREAKVTPREIAEVQRVVPGHEVSAEMGDSVPPPSPKHQDLEPTPGADEAIQS